MEGTFACPICSKVTPHEHSGEEVTNYRTIQRLRNESVWAAQHEVWKGVELIRVFTKNGCGTELLHHADFVNAHNSVVEYLLMLADAKLERELQEAAVAEPDLSDCAEATENQPCSK